MYVRRGVNCEVVPQPGHVNVTDVYGNTFENWCVDFIGTDKDCAPNGKTGCAPQDPDGLLSKFIFNTSDNGTRTPSQYIDSPLFPTTLINDSVDADTVLILGMEDDRDIILFNESNSQFLQLEQQTEVSGTATYS